MWHFWQMAASENQIETLAVHRARTTAPARAQLRTTHQSFMDHAMMRHGVVSYGTSYDRWGGVLPGSGATVGGDRIN